MSCDRGRTLETTTADSTYVNGKIFTVNKEQPWAEAIAIKDGKILAVGSNEDIDVFTSGATNVSDLSGKFAMPGLIDAHIHVGGFYISSVLEGKLLRFSGGASKEELQTQLKAYADKNPDLEIIVAENLNSGLFPGGLVPKAFLDNIVSARPVVAISDTEHEAYLNSAALERAGITADTPNPDNGEIVRIPETGEPAGTLKEAAAGRWGYSEFPSPSHAEHVTGQKALYAWLNSIGVTSIKIQHADPIEMAALSELDKSDELTVRAAVSWTWLSPLNPKSQEDLEAIIGKRGEIASELVDPDFVKINIDGTPTGTAYMLDPYEGSDSPGAPFIGQEELTTALIKFDTAGIGATFHVMGDGGMNLVVNALSAVSQKNNGLQAKHQLGHSSLISPENIQRIVELGVPAEFSAPDIHYDVDIIDAVEIAIGTERLKGWFPVKQFINAGGLAITASDGPLFWLDPLAAIQKMVLRPYPGRSNLTVEEVLSSMTINAAFALNAEDRLGSIEIGKWADMIVLDQNILEVAKNEIGKSKVLLTLLAGEVVFDAAVDPAREEAIEDAYDIELDTDVENSEQIHF
jgi:predicted amidohydrolase YtcJ